MKALVVWVLFWTRGPYEAGDLQGVFKSRYAAETSRKQLGIPKRDSQIQSWAVEP